jgi:CheY-like chemotaxis protein
MTKVLLIEDDPLIFRLYEKLFKLEGFEIELADNGQAGLDKLPDFKPDIILLDIMMPNMNGIEFLSKLTSDDATKHIPVVVLTNMSDMQVAHMATEKGAALVLIKSQQEPEAVVSAVRGVLQQAEQKAEDN